MIAYKQCAAGYRLLFRYANAVGATIKVASEQTAVQSPANARGTELS